MNRDPEVGDYSLLFSPITIGTLQVPNRVMMGPMGNLLHGEGGFVTPELIVYLEERAKSGVGVLFAPFAAVAPGHETFGVYSDEMIDGLSELASRIAKSGSIPFFQIAHQGANRPVDPMGPSAFKSRFYRGPVPREMTVEDIEIVISEFAAAAYRAKIADFAGIEVQAALGYLLGSFYSPHANRRKDQYGGVEGGLLFVEKIIRAIRDKCGNIPLGVKMNGHEHVDGGVGAELAGLVARKLEGMGVDFLHVVAASSSANRCEYCGTSPIYRTAHHLARGFLAQQVKEHVRIPVIADGGIWDPALGEEVLSRGMADIVAVSRAFIADPLWLKHVAERVPYRPCIRCNVCHIRQTIERVPVRCAVNPLAGQELTYPKKKAPTSMNVVVVGGGPAGMQAALTAAQCGHFVRLFEEQDNLGGNMRQAAVPSFKKPLRAFVDYLAAQLRQSSVEVHTGQRLEAATLAELDCDAVILATGSLPAEPTIQGLHKTDVRYAADFLRSPQWLGSGQKVVILGANKVGCELAWYIRAEVDALPVLIDVMPVEELMIDEYPRDRVDLLAILQELGVPLLCNRTVEGIEDGALHMRREAGFQEHIPCEKLIIAVGARADDRLKVALTGLKVGFQVLTAGDCVQPRNVYHAVQEGFQAAYSLGTQ